MKKTTFKIIIDRLDLINFRELVTINIKFSINKKQCKHLDGKIYGQCRGLARQNLINSNYKSPRVCEKKLCLLLKVKLDILVIGNIYHQLIQQGLLIQLKIMQINNWDTIYVNDFMQLF